VKPEHDVLSYGEVRKQEIILIHEAYAAAIGREHGDVFIGDPNLT
jgi:hypothetical protein